MIEFDEPFDPDPEPEPEPRKSYCPECHGRGYHVDGCPNAEDDILDDHLDDHLDGDIGVDPRYVDADD